MSIQSTVWPHSQLTIHTPQGIVTFEGVMATLRSFYAAEPTIKVLWDLRNAILTNLTADQVRTAVHFAAAYKKLRPHGQTALLVSQRLGDYGMARMVEIMGNIEGADIEIVVFLEYEEALRWLKVEL